MRVMKTRDVEALLGVGWWVLYGLIRTRKMPAVGKDSSGDLIWSELDVQRAREALAAGRRAKRYAPTTVGGVTPSQAG
jgi:hypothetical protein